jgi:hypothetical protein
MNEKQVAELVDQLRAPNPVYVPQVWVLSVGEYADQHVLGVVIGDEGQALRRSVELTVERQLDGEPSDMVEVRYEKAEVL